MLEITVVDINFDILRNIRIDSKDVLLCDRKYDCWMGCNVDRCSCSNRNNTLKRSHKVLLQRDYASGNEL